MEDFRNRRALTRVDVYMNALKSFAKKQIYDLDDNDVLDFLIFKDINESGRTLVHFQNCPHIGALNFDRCSDKSLCAKRHQAASLRVGIIAKLRRGFEDVGRKVSTILKLSKEILPGELWLVSTLALLGWSRDYQEYYQSRL